MEHPTEEIQYHYEKKIDQYHFKDDIKTVADEHIVIPFDTLYADPKEVKFFDRCCLSPV